MVGLLLVVGLSYRAWDAFRSPPLEPWHTFIPGELSAKEIDNATWADYLRAEERIFAEVEQEVSQKLDDDERVPFNRYFPGSPVYPGHFSANWNRSYIMEPDGPPAGAAVFLHGLTDSPYSLRHLANLYRRKGFVAIGIRLPGHGTVPAGLTEVQWEDWMAATRLAVREALRRSGPQHRLHIIGFSNGGALAVKYALDAVDDERLPRPERLVLISPMIGITQFARFAGIAGWPAFFPAFAKAAWLDILPEFNPFKYNSFPVNGARQSYLVTQVLQGQINRAAETGSLGRLPPIHTFQSVVDFTVSTRAVISGLYARLPANGSELTLFDINRSAKLGPLVSQSAETVIGRLLPAAPRAFRTSVITNSDPSSVTAIERTTESGSTTEMIAPLDLSYPPTSFSLSHVALPFPVTDPLYGSEPDMRESYGVNLGALSPRGERGVLVVPLDAIVRISSNPFYPYIEHRVSEAIDASRPQ
ncbi:alpha/beta hydrolase [Microvirga sp. WGZ8]|uniref:Alpha/beta hydrolase n=1 Tax=Microvirga puerhi TaxID=2876078 RepID=A0ABS7VH69_9HYPH|nr:alpha/beta hydrolase [Microvirga puerhi]MBZ6074856.1 alpha/beta hydrolase [Microvirga puerhi]